MNKPAWMLTKVGCQNGCAYEGTCIVDNEFACPYDDGWQHGQEKLLTWLEINWRPYMNFYDMLQELKAVREKECSLKP
jgi:hypothetical protein